MHIPCIFHQIWVGPDPFPDEFAEYQQTWLEHHPGWRLEFWTEETFPPASELRRPEAAERLRAPWERGDIFRLEILWKMGGVHVDTDFECLRPIEPLIDDTDFFIGLRKPGRLNGALMGSTPGHPLLDLLLDEIRPRASYGMQMGAGTANDKDETGPGFLDRMLLQRPEPKLIAPELFYPRTPDEIENAYAVHHRARAWKDAEGLRRSLDKADKRLRRAQEEAREWRLKYEQAEAELARLRSR
jgi:inositol phosphorylceramide mannosyltransferase catalytic subunit